MEYNSFCTHVVRHCGLVMVTNRRKFIALHEILCLSFYVENLIVIISETNVHVYVVYVVQQYSFKLKDNY